MPKSIPKILAIIPARGGSKRLKDKNIRLLEGKPILAYSIEAAKGSKYIDKVVVSSDSDRIGEIAVKYGAEFQKRPIELAQDKTATEPVLRYVAEQLGGDFDYVILLQPTSPLRDHDDVDRAIEIMLNAEYDTLISVTPFHGYLYKMKDNCLVPQYQARGRSQDREVEYVENGAIYISKISLIRQGRIFGNNIGAYEMDESRSIDIDNEKDLALAECILLSYGI